MSYKNIVRQADRVFYEQCKKNIGKNYFEKINYDKTLNERRKHGHCNPQELVGVAEFINLLKTTIKDIKNIVACRIVGSLPVLLDGKATKRVEEAVKKDRIILKARGLIKKPDIDVEVVVKDFIGRNYFSTNKELVKAVPAHRRVSVGYIDCDSICIYNIRSIVRWGFIRNEQIIKGKSWYRKQSKNIWKYLNGGPESYKSKVLAFVGAMHIYYAIKNSIKYGRVDKFTILKSEHPDIFNTVAEWKHCEKDLFFKEDL